MKPKIILGIETSCDETGAAVYCTDRGILSNALFSQIEQHKNFGGVVPEIASRTQLEKIRPIWEEGLKRAGVRFEDVDVVAVTNRPGLPGSLIVGVCFAKAVAWSGNKKIIGINHLEGHAFSPFLEYDVPFPHLCITASGGHTSLYLVKGFGDYVVLGQTQDDAAGEAFDKIAKMLNLGYPGGPEIEKRARVVDFEDFYAYPRGKKSINFSFSGLKTAVLYDLVKRGAYDLKLKKLLNDDDDLKNKVASSLLVCIADIFEQKLSLAIQANPGLKAITFVGGVACNKYLRGRLESFAQTYGLPLFVPSPQYCTDNAAMIALVGSYKAAQGHFDNWHLDIG